jgi:hypothetical protein
VRVVKAIQSLLIIACALFLASCGGNDSPSSSTTYAPPKADRSIPQTSFESAAGKTLRQVQAETSGRLGKLGLLIEPTAMVFYKGQNRYPLQVVTKDEKLPVDDVNVAVYIAKLPTSGQHHQGHRKAVVTSARGPFLARVVTLATDPQFTAQSTAENPRSATVVYVPRPDFPSNGEWSVVPVVEFNGKFYSARPSVAHVGEFHRVPRVGQRAPLIHTPTASSVDGDLSKLSTRRPPDTMNGADFASVLGRKPVVLLFASPEFSFNGTGGPTVDVAEQVSERFKKQVTFIDMEIYNGNDPAKGVRPQVRAYHLPSEPWAFAIDRGGRIVGEVEGAVGVAEMTQLAAEATGH